MMNEQIRDNGNAIWVGTAAGSMDYYTGATGKAELPIGSEGQSLIVASGIPGWGSPLSYGTISEPSETISGTSWADVPNASVNITVPTTSTLVAVASFYLVKYTSGSIYARWMLDGTAQPETKLEYETSDAHPGAVVGTKINVPPGTRTCKLQAYVTADSGIIHSIIGFILGFAE
jgi:hypothetical protein